MNDLLDFLSVGGIENAIMWTGHQLTTPLWRTHTAWWWSWNKFSLNPKPIFVLWKAKLKMTSNTVREPPSDLWCCTETMLFRILLFLPCFRNVHYCQNISQDSYDSLYTCWNKKSDANPMLCSLGPVSLKDGHCAWSCVLFTCVLSLPIQDLW